MIDLEPVPQPRVQRGARDQHARHLHRVRLLPVRRAVPAARARALATRGGPVVAALGVGFIVGSQVAPRLLRRFRPAYVIGDGLGDGAVGLAMLTQLDGSAGLHDARRGLGHHLARPGAGVHGDDRSDRRIGAARARRARPRASPRPARSSEVRSVSRSSAASARRLSPRARRSVRGRTGRGGRGGPRHTRAPPRGRAAARVARARRCSMPRARRSSSACA